MFVASSPSRSRPETRRGVEGRPRMATKDRVRHVRETRRCWMLDAMDELRIERNTRQKGGCECPCSSFFPCESLGTDMSLLDFKAHQQHSATSINSCVLRYQRTSQLTEGALRPNVQMSLQCEGALRKTLEHFQPQGPAP